MYLISGCKNDIYHNYVLIKGINYIVFEKTNLISKFKKLIQLDGKQRQLNIKISK